MRLSILLRSALLLILSCQAQAQTLPDTELLKLEGDIASHLVDGVDRFLLKQLDDGIATGIATPVLPQPTHNRSPKTVNDWLR